MSAKTSTVIKWMDELAPPHLAMPDDPIGLQLGSKSQSVSQVLVALDVTEEVVDEAVDAGAEMIIAHHAPLFRPARTIRTDTSSGRVLAKCLKQDIAVYVAHTNLDIAEGGVNDWLSEALGLNALKVLVPTYHETLLKLVVFIPQEAVERVGEAVYQAGAGHIGEYSRCGFELSGTGTFLPGADTSPYIGEAGRIERVEEVRLETIMPAQYHQAVVQAMMNAHPYEEPAYDVYPLERKGKRFGLGRVGKLERPVTLGELAEHAKSAYGVGALRRIGDADREIRTVAVIGGSGGRYYKSALSAGADVLVTGDVDHHTAHDALAAGLSLLDPGHHIEQIMKPKTASYLQAKAQSAGMAGQIEFIPSRIVTDPFAFV